MKVILAPDSFKGSLSSLEVGQALEEGIRQVFPAAEVVKIPMADGGEGTVEAFVTATQGRIVSCTALDPLGIRRESFLGIMGDGETAVIEMAAASGLTLVPLEQRNPMVTTTYGTGELILKALAMGCRRIILGIGGSATNDGGAGCLQALGVRLMDENGEELPFGGGSLDKLVSIDRGNLDPRLKDVEIIVACDVTNPLCGEQGASHVYGPQKGATPDMVKHLDQGLAHFAGVIQAQLGVDIREVPGAGAAGGFGAGLMAFLGARLQPGVNLVIQFSGIESHMANADLVITGEGKIDSQTATGKAPLGIARMAQSHNVPCLGIGGILEGDIFSLYDQGFSAFLSIARGPISLDEAIKEAYPLITHSIEQTMRVLKIGQGMRNV